MAVPGWLVNTIGSLLTTLYQAGKDVVQGLIDGIESMAGDLIDAAKGLPGKVTGAITGAFGIGSPSKVMAEIGKDVVAGLAAGIEAGTEPLKLTATLMGGSVVGAIRKTFADGVIDMGESTALLMRAMSIKLEDGTPALEGSAQEAVQALIMAAKMAFQDGIITMGQVTALLMQAGIVDIVTGSTPALKEAGEQAAANLIGALKLAFIQGKIEMNQVVAILNTAIGDAIRAGEPAWTAAAKLSVEATMAALKAAFQQGVIDMGDVTAILGTLFPGGLPAGGTPGTGGVPIGAANLLDTFASDPQVSIVADALGVTSAQAGGMGIKTVVMVLNGLFKKADDMWAAALANAYDPALYASTMGGDFAGLLTVLRQHGLAFAGGGIVPGALGAPTLAMVHGGERVLTPAQAGGVHVTFNINAIDGPSVERIAPRLLAEIERVSRRRD